MPHAVDQQEQTDEQLISRLLNADPTENAFEGLLSERIDSGPKADDAIDYEDIGDDDLADEDEVNGRTGVNGRTAGDEDDFAAGLFSEAQPGPDADADAENDGFDDLFGDGPSSPPADQFHQNAKAAADGAAAFDRVPKAPESPQSSQLPKVHSPESIREGVSFRGVFFEDVDDEEEEEEDENAEVREQRELFAQAQARLRTGAVVLDLPPAPQTDADVFQAIWHNYEPGAILRFGELLPHRRAYYVPKAPLKPPKPIQPTKVNLELAQDQEKGFKLPPTAAPTRNARQAEVDQKGVITVTDADAGDQSSDDDDLMLDDFDENEKIGGVTWQDLQILCEDWEIHTPDSISDGGDFHMTGTGDDTSFMDDWDREEKARPAKKRKISGPAHSFPVFQGTFPGFEDPEAATAKLARKVALNLNDPELLIDIQEPDSTWKKPRAQDFRRDISGSLTKSLFQKFNISNDESYDILKHNNREKVRNITNLNSLEHSLPALRLQYPFYKVSLSNREARSFHRPTFTFVPNQLVKFDKPVSKKKKQFKGQDPKAVYATSKDLSLSDNSNMMLMEYSEEYPPIMSNFGMCNRLLNYYRRKDKDDTFRPKLDIGEPVILTPNDQSPFAIFGQVRPGETVPTLHNAMFRAPVFAHGTKPTDFLVVRNTTGTYGSKWYIRNVENVFVVGQQFPSQQVPGTHSRKVTDISKRRLKMISYRIYAKNLANKSKGPTLSNAMIAAHLPGSDVAQNRGKMREFMVYDKETSSWRPHPAEGLPDENQMRGWIAPEDLCLVDAMQVGVRHLEDSGYQNDGDGAVDDDEGNEGQSIVQQLAPWNTTKNFLEASSRRAMLTLHGDGDPTGRGEGISMIKTSMKGGYKPVGESAKDKMDAKALKELNGHSYNVKKQEQDYNAAIEKIWEAQKASLSSNVEHSDVELDPDDAPEQDNSFSRGRTPQSQYGTPAAFSRRDDDTMSQFSRFSSASQQTGKVLRVIRKMPNKYGKLEEQEEIIRDPKVIRAYLKIRHKQEINSMKLEQLIPTGDEEVDARQRKRLLEELARLERNKERRQVREKAKAAQSSSSLLAGSGDGKAGGTTRKCANCNRPGHIKTNKKMCPMLNGIATTIDELESKERANPGSTFPPFGKSKSKAAAATPVESARTPQTATPQQLELPDFAPPSASFES